MSIYRINKLYDELMWFARFTANDTGYHRFPKLLRARINELKKCGVYPNFEIKTNDAEIEWAK